MIRDEGRQTTAPRDFRNRFWSNEPGMIRPAVQFIRRHQVAVVAAIIVLVLGAVLVSVQLQGRTDARIQAIRSRGYPTSLQELNDWYRPVPVEHNAALICARAFALPSFPAETNRTAELTKHQWAPAGEKVLTPGDLEELERLLSEAAPALELLHSIPANAPARYPLDFMTGFNVLLPHLAPFKRAMLLLETEMLVHSARGETDKAVQALVTADRVRSTLSGEPVLISKLVVLACTDILVRDIEFLLNAHTLPPEELQTLLQIVRSTGLEASMAQGLAGERTFGISFFENPGASLATGGNQNVFQKSAMGSLRIAGILSRDRAFYLDQMSNFVHAAEMPFPQRWHMSQSLTNISPAKFHIISRMLLPALQRSLERDTRGVARIRLAETALGVEAFRRAHSNRVPGALEELVPRHLASVPQDPFDGKPMRYRAYPDGYVVYSLGPDLEDNSGKPAPKKRGAASTNVEQGDLPFTVGKSARSGAQTE